MFINVPTGAVPTGGFPVCILLHGNGGNGQGMLNQFRNRLTCHVLVSPSGYLNSWNISDEASDAPDVEMVTELITQLQTYSNINPNRIRILGTSNGGALVNRVFIENDNAGVDAMCAIISQLSEPQYHNGAFYSPSGNTDSALAFAGYDTPKVPIAGRKYLSICNTNDGLIPYTGGASPVGVTFLDAQVATYIVAQSQGFTGAQITGTGANISGNVNEFSYLNGQVVHLDGDAMHGTNQTQLDYVVDFFDNCDTILNVAEITVEPLRVYPNPVATEIRIQGDFVSETYGYTLYDLLGKVILDGKVSSSNNSINVVSLNEGIYLLDIEGRTVKIVKQD